MSFRVIVATTLSDSGLTLLRGEIGGLAQVVQPEHLHTHPDLANAEALIIRDETEINAELLAKMPKLRVIGRAGAGIAGIDIEEATRRGIIVMNTPGINAISVAEYTFALILALARYVIDAHNQLEKQQWQRDNFIGIELNRKTLGIIGLGRVGREVARRANCFGMRVLAYDPYVDEEQLSNVNVKLVGMPELVTSSDIISVHAAYTPETEHLLNVGMLSMCKPNALLINTAHGRIIDEQALLTYLDNGRLAGAALDVFAHEPIDMNHPLLQHPRVIHTPHIGDSTREAQHDLGLMIVQQVLDALSGHDYRNVVNMPIVEGNAFTAILPYMQLAESIGKLQHHLAGGPIQRVIVEFKGEEFQRLLKPMTVALLRGLLMPVLGAESVNYINAPILAHERGIFVTQAKGIGSAHYTNLLTSKVQWAGGEILVSGALFNHTDPHIVQIDQYRTDIVPSGTLLIMGSYDIPGVIGRIGTILAENNINIADWRTGRAEPGGHTLSVVTLDQPLTDEVLEKIRQQEYIRHAKQIAL